MFQVPDCFGLVEGYSLQFLLLEKKWIKCFRSSTHQYQVVHCWPMPNLIFTKYRSHHLEVVTFFLLFFSNFRRFLLAQSSWLLKSPWTEALPAAFSHSSSMLFAVLLRVHTRYFSKSLPKMLNDRTLASQILDKSLLKTIEVWFEKCSWLPVSGVKNWLLSFLCCLSYKLLTSLWLFPLVQRQESFIKGDVKV